MKRSYFIVFIIFLTSFIYCASAASSIQPYIQVTSVQIQMRDKPSASADIIASIPSNTILQYLGKNNNWLHVQIPKRQDGYIDLNTTKFVHYKNIELLTTSLILEGPDASYRAIGQANRGADLKVIGEESQYYLVVVRDNQLGWIDIRDTQETSTLDFVQIDSDTKTNVAPYDAAPQFSTMKAGTKALKLDEIEGWILVGDSKGISGWIKRNQMAEIDYTLSTVTSANLRDGPSANYNVIGMLEPRTPLIVIQKQNDWYDVQTREGLRGWIAASAVGPYSPPQDTPGSEAPPADQPTQPTKPGGSWGESNTNARYMILNQKSEIRQGFSTDFYVHTTAPEGSIVLVIGSRDGWARIRYQPQGRIGWIQQDRLKEVPIYFTNCECNIRRGYSTDFEILRSVPPGTPLAKLDRVVDDWYRIYMPDGVIGWIRNDLITEEKNFYITNQFANVRDGAGIDNTKIATLEAANVVSVVNRRGEWYQIKFAGNYDGWIMNELVSYVYDYGETNQEVTLYNDPNKKSKLSTTLPQGAGVFIIGRNNTTVLVRNAQQKGWIDLESLDPAYMNTLGNFISKANILASPSPTPSQPTPSQPQQPDVTTLYTYQETNIRFGPGLQYAVLIRLKPGAVLSVISKQGDWYNVSILPGGQTGYVLGDVVSKERVEATSVAGRPFYVSQNFELLAEPNHQSAKVERLQRNSQVTRITVDGDWARVTTANNKDGWIPNSLLKEEPVKAVDYDLIDTTIDYGMVETTGEVNLREGASELTKRIGRIPRGTRLKKLGFKGAWYDVETDQGRGYISKNYAKDVTSRPVITLTEVEIKETRSPNAATIGKWYAGRVLVPTDKVGSWYAVPSNVGEKGWVNEKDVADLKFPELYAKSNVPVLREPQADGTVNFTLSEGDIVRPVYEITNWYFIKLSVDKAGWLPKASVGNMAFPKIKIRSDANAYRYTRQDGNVAGSVRKNDVLQPVAKSGAWYKIPLGPNQYGWVYANVYDEVLEENVVVEQNASIHEGPGREYKLSGFANTGEVYKSVVSKGGWTQIIKVDGDIGWIETKTTKRFEFDPTTISETIDVYSGPGEQFNVIKTVPANTKLTRVDETEGWLKIKLSDIDYGWIKKEADTSERVKIRVVFTMDITDIKSEASENATNVKRVEPATDLLIIGESGDWYKVRLTRDNLEGWVRKEMVFE